MGSKSIMRTLWLLVAIIIFYCVYNSLTMEGFTGDPHVLGQSTHGFQWDPLWVGRTANDCYNLHPDQCMQYSNCGLCQKGANIECVPGDEQGPLFKETCEGWGHTNYYDRGIFGETVTTVTPPWSKIYPDYEAWYPSPVARSSLF